jgi:hypothetical protein
MYLTIERIRLILFKPHQAWIVIKGESTGFADVLTHYLLPLVAIPAFCGMIGYTFIGMRFGFRALVYRVPLPMALVWAVVFYVATLFGIYVEGIVINTLAPSFHAKQHAIDAFKLAAYAYTPAAIAGILNIFPSLSVLVFLLSLYSIYLLYCGLPVMMEAPQEKVFVYLVLIVVVMIVVYLLFRMIPAAILSAAWRPS